MEKDVPMVRKMFLTFGLLALPSLAWAGSPHFVGDPVLVISGDTLTVSGTEAGLGNEDQIDIVITADALCINGGGKHPRAVNKESIAVAGTFPVQNGKANFSLVAVAGPFQPPCDPPMTIGFANVVVCDTTNNLCRAF